MERYIVVGSRTEIEGAAISELIEQIGEWIEKRGGLWLDAGTGAGNATLRLAQILKGRGHVLSVDIDEASWSDWAEPKLKQKGLLDVVSFRKGDLADLSDIDETFNGILCSTTLSAMGISAMQAVIGWPPLIQPGGLLIIHDYLPQSEAADEDEEIVNQAWRLYKAAEMLSGQHHYEEIEPGVWEGLLRGLGFSIESILTDPIRKPRSKESLDEWLSIDLEPNTGDPGLDGALQAANEKLKDRVRVRGSMLKWSGEYLVVAGKTG